jgi:putative peptidoglycan lipid II flippase
VISISKFKCLRAWQSKTTNRRILSAILVLIVMTGAAKLAATAKELIVAGYFGVSETVDAFLIAFLLPMFAINVLAGSFSSALMPTYIRTRDDKGMEAAQKLFSSIMTLGIVFLVAAAIVLATLSPLLLPLLASGFSSNAMELTQNLFYWLLPVLVFSGIGQLYSTAMNAEERFVIVALTPAVTPVCAVIFLVLLIDTWGIDALAAGTLFGSAIEMVILASVAVQRGISLRPRWGKMTDELRVVVGQYIPMVSGAFLMSGTVLVDQAMAAMLEPGSVATLNFANRVVALILGVGSMALGTAVLPHFSRMVADEDWKSVRYTFRAYARLIVLFSIPITALLFLFSEEIIRLLFERGAFSSEDAKLVGQVQAYFILQVPFYLLGILGVRMLSAIMKNSILMKISFVNLIINIIGNYFLVQYFGVAGIALSTAIVYALSFGMIYFSLFENGIGFFDGR